MGNYNYGTAINKLIDNYQEMLELIIQARLASDRIDDWKNTLAIVINPEQIKDNGTDLENIYTWICIECNEVRIDDDRVFAGLKCSHCAYNI